MRIHPRTIVLASAAAAAAIVACTYGNYDGSWDGGVDAGSGAAGGGTVVLSRTVDPSKEEVLVTPDGVLEVTFPKGAFSAPTAITITQLEERTVDALIVPTYAVSSPAPPSLPVQIVFRGNNPNGGSGSRALLVARRRPDGSFAPTEITSAGFGGSGPSSSYWGLTTELGTFSLVFETLQQSSAFSDVSAASCIGKCCTPSGGTAANAVLTSTGIACQSAPNLSCFVETCPDFGPLMARANDLAKNNPSVPLQCRPFAALGANNCPGQACNAYPGTCNTGTGGGGGVCCVANKSGTCFGSGGGGGTCNGIAIRCDLDTKCPNGTACCVFDTDAYCTASCPTGRTMCRTNTDCDGGVADAGPDAGACQDAPACPFRTCGPPPPSCL